MRGGFFRIPASESCMPGGSTRVSCTLQRGRVSCWPHLHELGHVLVGVGQQRPDRRLTVAARVAIATAVDGLV